METRKPAFSATKILLPIDFSTTSEAGIEAATGLAKQFHAAIHLVHILPEFPDFNGSDFFPEFVVTGEESEAVERKLEDCEKEMRAQGLIVTSSLETGNDIVGNLMRVIKREKTDMLVLSTHGLSGWRPLILGSIAEQVIKLVHCTLLLLQSPHEARVHPQPALACWDETFIPQTTQAHQPESGDTGSAASAHQRMDQSAEDLAEQCGRTERRYDEAHSLVTK